MKLFGKLIVLFVTIAFAGNAYATELGLGVSSNKTFSVNPDVNKPVLNFISEAPLEDIHGGVYNADHIMSTVDFNPKNIENTKGKVQFKVAGLETGIDTRDQHLQSPTWLNAEKYPNVTFDLKSMKNVKVDPKGENMAIIKGTAVGDLSLHGETKTMEIPLSITYIKENADSKKRAPGDLLSTYGRFTIALKDFNVKGMGDIIGSKVGETIDINFKLFYNSK